MKLTSMEKKVTRSHLVKYIIDERDRLVIDVSISLITKILSIRSASLVLFEAATLIRKYLRLRVTCFSR